MWLPGHAPRQSRGGLLGESFSDGPAALEGALELLLVLAVQRGEDEIVGDHEMSFRRRFVSFTIVPKDPLGNRVDALFLQAARSGPLRLDRRLCCPEPSLHRD